MLRYLRPRKGSIAMVVTSALIARIVRLILRAEGDPDFHLFITRNADEAENWLQQQIAFANGYSLADESGSDSPA